MQKDRCYQPVGLCDDDVLGGNGRPYRDEPGLDHFRLETREHGMLTTEDHTHHNHQSQASIQKSNSTPNRLEEHPLETGGDLLSENVNTLRMRRMGGFLRGGSEEQIVVLEGLASNIGGHQHRQRNGSMSSLPSPSKLNCDRNLHSEVSSASEEETDYEDEYHSEGEGGAGNANGSRGEEASGLFSASHGSSFDLLDDEDEINLQRYHRDFPYCTNYHDDLGWDAERTMMENSAHLYHPRTESHGSHSKDPWIRMVTQHNQQSPTHGGHMSIYAIHSISDLLLYLQGVRRQARQRRAQRLLTMPSDQWRERIQFFCLMYCWDTTDVGLLVIAIMLVFWFTGLLWLARINARNNHAANAQQSGAEYNGNAEFDGYQEEGRFVMMFQWWWWGLGFVLLVRILGPVAVQNVNHRRRERRRQRFMSGNMEQQQRRMQQCSPMVDTLPGGVANTMPSVIVRHEEHNMALQTQEDGVPAVEITEASTVGNASLPITLESADLGGPRSME